VVATCRSRPWMMAPSDFFYDPVAHLYTCKGEPWPSVTQALDVAGLIDKRWYPTPTGDGNGPTDRGRAVHKYAMALDVLKTMKEVDVPPTVGGAVEAYRGFVRDKAPVYEHIEEAFYCRRLRYGGRPDRIFRRLLGVDGPGTLELKTGGAAAWHGYQTAGYFRLRPRGSRWVLYLHDTGRWKLVMNKDGDDHRVFLNAL
jgi:hypothetical protein